MKICLLNKKKLLAFNFVYRGTRTLKIEQSNVVFEKMLIGYLKKELDKIASKYVGKTVNSKYYLKIKIGDDNYT
jgi:hypothetical protein